MLKEKYSWNVIMRYCYFTFNIKPNDFWNMTMLEILALDQELQSQQITRRDLDYLIKKFS